MEGHKEAAKGSGDKLACKDDATTSRAGARALSVWPLRPPCSLARSLPLALPLPMHACSAAADAAWEFRRGPPSARLTATCDDGDREQRASDKYFVLSAMHGAGGGGKVPLFFLKRLWALV